MINSRTKGHDFERGRARFYAEIFGEAKRGLQSRDGSEAPDVICPALPDFWIECKRYKQIGVYPWWRQAKRAGGEGLVPILHIREDKGEPLVIVSEEHWKGILQSLWL